ncbi:hypothetical protein NicSoilB8_45780 (plasmid) [Arthrobacter sp. NicSoilB8]|nr:hypothetical protein NicSoilB8_45780 [Arthrobacter sp. NicSoilB8]
MTFDQVWPVAAFFLGVLSTLFIETVKARRARAEELRNAAAAREQFFQDRREAFELDHLLKVNEALSALTSAVVEAHNEYIRNYEVSPEARQRVEKANGGVVAVRHLILDDKLREEVRLAHGALLRDGRLAGKTEALESDVVVDALQLARQGIAARIRSLYLRNATEPSVH